MPTRDLVEIGHGAVTLRDVTERGDRGDVAVHRIDALERDQLRRRRVGRAEQAVEVVRVVVLEDPLLGAAVADALDHRGVVELVRVDDAARELARQRAQRRVVRDVARGEEQRRLLAVEVGQLPLEGARGSGLLPEMFLVPPEPAPTLSIASCIACSRTGLCPIAR